MPINITLNNGVSIPAVGLGVYQIPTGWETVQAVSWALEAGYRHIDTASFYGNEADVGKAVRQSGIPRKEIFVTTKLWPTDFLRAEKAFEKSLDTLGLEYIDLYLIHWPSIGKGMAWKALQKIYASGRAKSIGVSNYSISQIDDMLQKSEIVPVVNQIEFSPFRYRKDVLEYCGSKNIIVEAYSPLTRGKRLNDTILKDIARTYAKSPAQLMIRWALQHGLVVIPKSSKRERIVENFDVFDFEIKPADMNKLDMLDENYRALLRVN